MYIQQTLVPTLREYDLTLDEAKKPLDSALSRPNSNQTKKYFNLHGKKVLQFSRTYLSKRKVVSQKKLKISHDKVPVKALNGYTFEVNGYSSKPIRMQCFLRFLKMKKILVAHWLRAYIHSSQKCIHLGILTVITCIGSKMS